MYHLCSNHADVEEFRFHFYEYILYILRTAISSGFRYVNRPSTYQKSIVSPSTCKHTTQIQMWSMLSPSGLQDDE